MIPVLSIVAPMTVMKMYEIDGEEGLKKLVWPSSKLF